MEMELLRDYHFGLHQLTEILGHACAVAITKVCVSNTSILLYCTLFNQKHHTIHTIIFNSATAH